MDAWLVFLTYDEPERIAELIQAYPEFKRMYEDVYELCRNMEDEIDASKKLITEQEMQLSEKDQQLSEKEQLLKQQELTNQLYTLLSQDERIIDLSRAVKDEAFRKQLIDEYHLKSK